MKLLILTQKVDISDDLLGFFHGWLQKLAPRVERLSVITLGVGEYHLPPNVQVFSLGKNDGNSPFFKKIKYVINFYRYIWRLRNDYDLVFVHMNAEYVLLGAKFWRLWGKKIVLWYAHYKKPLKLKIAAWLAHCVVTSAKPACRLNSKKLRVLQQGIDTEKFKPENLEGLRPDKILFLGRISPVKKLEALIEAAGILKQRGFGFSLDIVGEPTLVSRDYFENIRKMINELGLESNISFMGRVANEQAPQVYNRYGSFVNLTASGSFDKTTLEAMSCGLIVFVSNRVFENILPPPLQKLLMFREGDNFDLAQKIIQLAERPGEELIRIKQRLRQIIVEQHSLDGLIEKLVNNFKELTKR